MPSKCSAPVSPSGDALPETPSEAARQVDYDSIDFFTDQSRVPDPYPYFDHLRSQCPVLPTANYGVVAVTGHA